MRRATAEVTLSWSQVSLDAWPAALPPAGPGSLPEDGSARSFPRSQSSRCSARSWRVLDGPAAACVRPASCYAGPGMCSASAARQVGGPTIRRAYSLHLVHKQVRRVVALAPVGAIRRWRLVRGGPE